MRILWWATNVAWTGRKTEFSIRKRSLKVPTAQQNQRFRRPLREILRIFPTKTDLLLDSQLCMQGGRHHKIYMAASQIQNSRSGSTPQTHRRSRTPIQTCDPDRSRPHDPDLWSRPLASFCLGLLIQTPCFILEWTCWILPHPFPYGWTVALKDMLSSCLLRLACYSCLACSLLLAAVQLEHFGSRPVTKIWSKSAYPVPDLVPRRSRPVPDRSRSFRNRSMESNLMEEEVSGQCKIFWFFLSRIYTLIIMIQFTPFQTCGTGVLRKLPFQTCGSPRNVPDPFIDPYPYIYIYIYFFSLCPAACDSS